MARLGDLLNQWIPEWIASGIDPCAPEYEPDKWNKDPIVKQNNCYNYACDLMTSNGKIAEPGYKGSGAVLDRFDSTLLRAALLADGWKQIAWDERCGCRECCHIIAAAVVAGRRESNIPTYVPIELQAATPTGDYHFYRKDKNGMWSHKWGKEGPVKDVDQELNPINDPRTAKMYFPQKFLDPKTRKAATRKVPYEVCGLFCINKKKFEKKYKTTHLDGP